MFEIFIKGPMVINGIMKECADMEREVFMSIMAMAIEEYAAKNGYKANEMMHEMAEVSDSVLEECGEYHGGIYNGETANA